MTIVPKTKMPNKSVANPPETELDRASMIVWAMKNSATNATSA
jgi:hypothetical protein